MIERSLKETIADLRQKGLSNKKIADNLGIAMSRVEYYARRLLQEGAIEPAGKDIDIEYKHEKIRQMVLEGWTNQEIADEIGTTNGTIKVFICHERQAGRLPLAPEPGNKELEDQITVLRNSGFSNTCIAETLDVPIKSVEYYIYKLLENKKVVRRHKSQNPEFFERQEKIRQMVLAGAKYKDIAEAVGSTEGSIKTFVRKERLAGRLPIKLQEG